MHIRDIKGNLICLDGRDIVVSEYIAAWASGTEPIYGYAVRVSVKSSEPSAGILLDTENKAHVAAFMDYMEQMLIVRPYLVDPFEPPAEHAEPEGSFALDNYIDDLPLG